MSADTSAAPARPISIWKRSLFAILVFVAVVAVAIVVIGYRSASSGRSELAEVYAEMDRTDPKWRLEDLVAAKPEMVNVDNSVRRIEEAARASAPWGPKEHEAPGGGELLRVGPANLHLDAGRSAVVLASVRKRERAIELAVSLKDMPRGRSSIKITDDMVSTLLPHVQVSREVAHLLSLDSERLLAEGRGGEVPDRVIAMFNAGSSLRDDPFFISQLVRNAIRSMTARQVERYLGMARPTDAACGRLMERIEAEMRDNPLRDGLRGERACMNQAFDNLIAGRVGLADFFKMIEGRSQLGAAGGILISGGAILYKPRLYEDRANFLRWMNRAVAISELPPAQQKAAWGKFDVEFKEFVNQSRSSLRNIVTTLLAPAITKLGEQSLRDRTMLSCANAALAAERFRLANGRWPASLEELLPAFLKEVPPDLFSGKPLLLRATPDGVVIYSVGPDGLDDGGLGELVGRGPRSDLGVRLWNAELRGVEALKVPSPEYEPLAGMPTPDYEKLKLPKAE